MKARDKVLSRRELKAKLAEERDRGRRTVLTNGCFDVLHVGHVRSLEQAAGLGDVLIVAVNRDRRAAELKGPGRPLVPERQRAEMLAALACVDWVVLFGEDDASRLIRDVRPDVVCKGGDYRGGIIPEQRAVEAGGGAFELLRQVPGVRSSGIIERAQLLGGAKNSARRASARARGRGTRRNGA